VAGHVRQRLRDDPVCRDLHRRGQAGDVVGPDRDGESGSAGAVGLLLDGSEEPEVVEAAFQRGAAAFIVKRIDPADLPAVIRQAFDGNVFYPVEARPAAVEAVDSGLTQREADILRALADGLSNKQIARQFWLSEQTIKFHLTNIYRKLDVGSRTEAVRHAYEHGLIENPLLRAAAP
jgi:DNA-binding NarL/FixJ family response regulator